MYLTKVKKLGKFSKFIIIPAGICKEYNIKVSDQFEVKIESGNIVLKKEPGISGVDYISLDISILDPGIYFVRLNFTTGSLSKIIQVSP